MNILDLPDEMLLAIFNKMNMIDVLYSLVGVNQRLDQLIFDPLYICHLNARVNSLLNSNSNIANHILDRICEKIIPWVHHKITKLTAQPLSIERILYRMNYPQLHFVSLVDFGQAILVQHLTGDTKLRRLFINQITHLNAEINDDTTRELSDENNSNIFELILSLGKCLIDLTFSQSFRDREFEVPTLNITSTGCVSLTLTKLKIKVNTFDDCLYVLDGRLQCLSTFIIDIFEIFDSSAIIGNTVKRTEPTYIVDGIQLHDEVLIFMPQLNKLTFSIHTLVINKYVTIDLPSNDDIQHSFIKRKYQSVGSYADDKFTNSESRCHIYSLPYQFDTFLHLANCFQGGIFDKVRSLAMTDQRPFEHELFDKISRDFPFLQELIVLNSKPQKNKQRTSKLITFFHLVELDLQNKKLDIEYEQVAIVTNNFTNGAARYNCSQLRRIVMHEPYIRGENFHSYFPLLNNTEQMSIEYTEDCFVVKSERIDNKKQPPPQTMSQLSAAKQLIEKKQEEEIKQIMVLINAYHNQQDAVNKGLSANQIKTSTDDHAWQLTKSYQLGLEVNDLEGKAMKIENEIMQKSSAIVGDNTPVYLPAFEIKSWCNQTDSTVTIKVPIKDLTAERIEVSIKDTNVIVLIKTSSLKFHYSIQFNLIHYINPIESSYNIADEHIEIKLCKRELITW
ncbi:unnamed protein product [Rotaria socialis]|uniref:CS domain-containing protein n=2 Tax=Rotaria socialis TaxID=392032 RepID=A0A820L6S5_9BILA|nr:unnamed protein product [Rotaria socialis]